MEKSFKRGFNQFKIDTNKFSQNGKYSIDIISQNYLDIKIFALDNNNNVVSSDTEIVCDSWYNEISVRKNYKINISKNECDIYVCFHAHSKGNIKIENNNFINCKDDFKIFDLEMFRKKNTFPTWQELVYEDINMDYSNGYDYPLIEATYDKEEIITMMETLTTNKLTMGENVINFEKKFAEYVGSNYAVMVNSGSSANLLSMAVATNYLRSNKLQPGDKIIVPNICWSTSVWPIIQMNLLPVFVDVNPLTLNMDIEDLKRKLTPEIKGIVAVHILGNSTDMDELMKIVKDNNLFLMEDTCESLGSTYENKTLGTFGDFGTYSFYYSHHITTIEGGMVVCNKEEDYQLLLCLRAHGWTRYLKNKQELENTYKDVDPRFLFVNVGYNLRPMETQGSMGIVQLNKLQSKNNNRIYNHKNITERIINDPRNKNIFVTPHATRKCVPAWFALPFIINEEYINHYKPFLKHLTDNKVENRPIITGNFARQPIFKFLNLDINPEEYKGAEILHKRAFFIGLACEQMSEERVNKLIDIFYSYDFTS